MSSLQLEQNFYISLPSDGDSTNVFADNIPTSYKTPLAAPINFNQNEEWEVGLSEIYFPNFYYNIFGDMCKLRVSSRNSSNNEIIIPEGYYTPRNYVQVVNKLLSNIEIKSKLIYDKNAKKIKFKIAHMEQITLSNKRMIEMLGFNVSTDMLQGVLGILHNLQKSIFNIQDYDEDEDEDEDKEGKDNNKYKLITPNNPTYFNAFTQQMFIYSNIVEHSHIGDTMTPLLKTVNIIPSKEHQDVIHLFFNKPRYVKVKKGKNPIKDISIHMTGKKNE